MRGIATAAYSHERPLSMHRVQRGRVRLQPVFAFLHWTHVFFLDMGIFLYRFSIEQYEDEKIKLY